MVQCILYAGADPGIFSWRGRGLFVMRAKFLDATPIFGVVFVVCAVTTLIHVCLLSDSGSYVLTHNSR